MKTNTKNYDTVNYIAEKIIGIGDSHGLEILGLGYKAMIVNEKLRIDVDEDDFMHDILLNDYIDIIQRLKEEGLKYVIVMFDYSNMTAQKFMDSDYIKQIKEDDFTNFDENRLVNNIWSIDKNIIVVTLF